MATNQAIACAVPTANLDPHYLLLYLQSQKRRFVDSGKGGAQPNISQTIIKGWSINLPPIEEQKRLLGLADLHHATIENLNEMTLELETQYLSLRRSLLNAAFSGDLVA
jgi:type I restriction enzyme S subunit